MKIEELTHEEIVALDEAGVNRLIKLARAKVETLSDEDRAMLLEKIDMNTLEECK